MSCWNSLSRPLSRQASIRSHSANEVLVGIIILSFLNNFGSGKRRTTAFKTLIRMETKLSRASANSYPAVPQNTARRLEALDAASHNQGAQPAYSRFDIRLINIRNCP